MTPVFKGKVWHNAVNFAVKVEDRTKLNKYLVNLDGHDVELIIRKPKTKRSENQSRYYFGVVIELLSKELGYDQEELHEILKYKFLKKNSALNGMEYVKSTAKLTTGEFEEYLDKIKRWSAEFLNIVIPNPNEAE